jgi:flagella basal body P-ring formation protein FlgA
MPNLLARTLSGLALLLVLVAAPAAPRASMWLAPGEPLLQDHLESLVAPALPPGELLELVFSQPALPLVNPAASEAFLQLLELRYEPRTERFSGAFLVRLESGEERVLGLAGRAQAMVEIMVPVRTIAAGERLQPSLLEPVVLAERLLRADTLSDAGALVGLEATRRLLPGRPVRRNDVQAPRLVRRGDAVEVLYRAPGIELVTLARALDDGARGDMVTVTNLDSGQRLSGLVTDTGRIEIGAGQRAAR